MSQFIALITVVLLGAIVFGLGFAVVLIDRINFPQRPFKAEEVDISTPKDNKGAHID